MISNKLAFRSIVMALAFAGLAACQETQPVSEAPPPDCVWPGSDKAAPGWICDEPVPGLDVQAVGSAPKSAAGAAFMKQQAALQGRAELARQMKVKVSAQVKNYIGTTGIGEGETVDAAAESVARSLTVETLQGSKIYKSMTSPTDGQMYVLMGINQAQAQQAVQAAVNTSMKNDQALWQKFQAKKAFDEMAAEIAKMEGSE